MSLVELLVQSMMEFILFEYTNLKGKLWENNKQHLYHLQRSMIYRV